MEIEGEATWIDDEPYCDGCGFVINTERDRYGHPSQS